MNITSGDVPAAAAVRRDRGAGPATAVRRAIRKAARRASVATEMPDTPTPQAPEAERRPAAATI